MLLINQNIKDVKEILASIHSIIPIHFILGILFILLILIKKIKREKNRKNRRDYYQNEYLKSDEWRRKRYVVFKRDNWRCVFCGNKATQVHHKRYAKNNIGKEPIDWLVSVCKPCHDQQHQ